MDSINPWTLAHLAAFMLMAAMQFDQWLNNDSIQ